MLRLNLIQGQVKLVSIMCLLLLKNLCLQSLEDHPPLWKHLIGGHH